MIRLRFHAACVLALLSVFGAGTLIAQEVLPPQLVDWEQQCERRHAALQDLTIVTEFIIHAPEGDVHSEHLIREKGNKIRMDVFRSGDAVNNSEKRLDFVGITDDKNAWTITRQGERKSEGSAINQQDPNFFCWQFTPGSAKIISEEELRGKTCSLVEVQVRHTTYRLWVDKETQFVLQHDEIPPNGKPTRWIASNFNTVSGEFKIPQKSDMYMEGHLMATLLVQSVTFNTGLTDDLFDPDKVNLDLGQ